jgi:tRNA A37 threonylcarbamoyladenosine synthetase subunit TsaC/SUA5/YrdC
MFNEFGIASLTSGDSLPQGELRQVVHTLRSGGICILPSDTCYGVAALPFRRDAMSHLATILPDKAAEPIPLAFGSLGLIEQFVKLTASDERLADTHWPGPLTLVCEINDFHEKRALESMLHTKGTIGVRISDSAVERQISIELQRPITTCALRDESGHPVQSFDDAFNLTRSRMKAKDERFLLFGVRTPHLTYNDLSTVVTVQEGALPVNEKLSAPDAVYLYRPGVFSRRTLERTLRRMSPSDWADWT